jgi:hypothetical protein
MEQDQNTSLFGLNLDQTSKSHLSEAARWAKFLAIVGFIACILIVLAGVFAGSIFEKYGDRYEGFGRNSQVSTRDLGAVAAVMYVLVALLYFFPCLFLFNFASKMKTALLSNDQDTLSRSFQNLKKTFRYLGVLTIILLCFWVLGIVVALLGRNVSG